MALLTRDTLLGARRGWGELMKFVLLDVAYHEERRAVRRSYRGGALEGPYRY